MKKYIIVILIFTFFSCGTVKYIDSLENTKKSCNVLRPEMQLKLDPPPEIDEDMLLLMSILLESDEPLYNAFGKLIKWYEKNKLMSKQQFEMLSYYAICLENGGVYEKEKR